MSKFDEIKIPNNIDKLTSESIQRGIEYNKRQKKKRLIIAAASTLVISITAIGVSKPTLADSIPIIGDIIEYFNLNKDSLFKSDKDDFQNIGQSVNASSIDKNIEYIIENISVDDNYITLFHSVKTNEKIVEINEELKNPYDANPIASIFINGNDVSPLGLTEHEAKYIAENELKGMQKIDISHLEIVDGQEIEFRVTDIFGIKGNWNIKVKIDKSKAEDITYSYNVNKDYNLVVTYEELEENVKVKHNINVDKVVISPLASTITINELPTTKVGDLMATLGSQFALFDQNGKSLDVLDKGGFASSSKKEITHTTEFLKGNHGTEKLKLVPISYDYGKKNEELKAKSIDSLPIEFNISEHGKIIIEDIKILENEIRYTYYKEGVVPSYLQLKFYDENDKPVKFGSRVEEGIDRENARYTTVLKVSNGKEDLPKIKKVSTFNNNDLNVLYDQAIEIELKK